MHLKNGKKLYNERGITFFHETERYVNNLNIYNRSKNGTNLWDDLINTTTLDRRKYDEHCFIQEKQTIKETFFVYKNNKVT